jgi:cell fate regulator YaaT (PSP1 superfamily)
LSCSSCDVIGAGPSRLVRVVLRDDLPGQVCVSDAALELQAGTWVVVATKEGERLGKLAPFEPPPMRPCPGRTVGTVVRKATPREVARGERLAQVEHDALAFCRERVRQLGLRLRPVTATVPLDRDTLSMTFAAEDKVELRGLTRDLARHLNRRVELRQVGVRDQARAAGGWGPCGRPLCCSSHMTHFHSITIRMAKTQHLALNPARISGMCGRLMCCLAYEMPPPAGPKERVATN